MPTNNPTEETTHPARHGETLPLPAEEMIRVLESQRLGHLGCSAGDDIYVVPISYAYEDGALYSHSPEGQKIRMMRGNPNVCVQVERVEGPFAWQSVIAWGTYEELRGEAAAFGMRLLVRALGDGTTRTSPLQEDFASILSRAVIYRIVIRRMTGRCEGRPERSVPPSARP